MSTPTSTARSSLEEMLDSIKQRDSRARERETLPPLPSRPGSRSRSPSKRTLPMDFKVEETDEERALKGYQEMVLRSSIFGTKRIAKLEHPEESPYVKAPELMNYRARLEDVKRPDLMDMTTLFLTPLLDKKFRWRSSMDSALRKKLHVWCLLPDVKWELASVKAVKGEEANILLSDGKVLTVSVENLLPANPDILHDVDDLIQLIYLHEPSVLHSLKCRYSNDKIYTKAGNILVAINPFKRVPLYGNDLVSAYRKKARDSPHVYAVADSAFSKMMRDGVNQSIIISGESGSGKTETAKNAMQYLAALGGGSGIEHVVLQTNSIMEAFGNAKTSKNDNSSRFGKFMEISFSMDGRICGAKIQASLLEKSRVVERAEGERSYHIFYQLCAGAPAFLKEKLNLKAANEYYYLKNSDCLRISDVDDAQRFHNLTEALNTVKLSKEKQENAFATVAAVLSLGNIEFSVIDNENHVEVVPNEGVINAAKLMGCRVPQLMLALSARKIQIGKDEIVQKLTLPQAIKSRDALSKAIYSSLFDWLVEQINKSLEVEKLFIGRSINILDICGFEYFHKNSFQQFCINYMDERLQQHFNRHLLKLEQEEYIREGIDWNTVEFMDNTECLNLFEKKPNGLLSLLDQESASPEATDLTFTEKLKQHLYGSSCFNGESEGAFQVRHCAGEVLYDTSGFLEKNRDRLYSDCVHLLLSCDHQLLQSFASRMLNRSRDHGSFIRRVKNVGPPKQCVAAKLKGQLFKLMLQLENTTPHFIRCIKPNSNCIPGNFEDNLVLHQLKSCGLLEVIKISRSGYPTRMTHRQFAERYGFLLMETVLSKDPLSIAVTVLQKLNILPEMYQVGYAKLFFRTGQIAALENIRTRTIKMILLLQKFLLNLQYRRRFQEIKKGAIVLQSFIRGSLVRNNLIARRNGGANMHPDILDGVAVHNLQDTTEKHIQTQDSVPAELEMRILNAEGALRQKEEENLMLKNQLQEYETRLSENEGKMKSMQDSWKIQMSSMQVHQPAQKNSYEAVRVDAIPSPAHHHHEPKNSRSLEIQIAQVTPTSQNTAAIKPNVAPARSSEITQNTLAYSGKEFDPRKQASKADARKHAKKSGKLKRLFSCWKKDHKHRLKDAKDKIIMHGPTDGVKIRKKCWTMKAKHHHKHKASDGEKSTKRCWCIKTKHHKQGASDGEKTRKKWWSMKTKHRKHRPSDGEKTHTKC